MGTTCKGQGTIEEEPEGWETKAEGTEMSPRGSPRRAVDVCALNIIENPGWFWSENGVKGRRKQMKSFMGRGSWALGILACQ